MSKIGKLPITIPQGVQAKLVGDHFTTSNAKDQLELTIPDKINVDIQDEQILVTRLSELKKVKSNHGTIRALINNMVTGLVTPWQKDLEVLGTGYKAILSGQTISLIVGFIKPVDIQIPPGITVTLDGDTKINITGIDKAKVGQLASNIRKVRPPEPYKGKGIRYKGEFIKLKPGKAAKTAA